ncbi:TIR domain-containing protein [Pseudomonas sp. WS 5010]|uniref:TIR domain-containing protein n=1 Tax=Pseudomonas sp. WS 5010 TaxID=2717489 RepID=UPI0014752CE5|nr:TIR domain-containing protein [Pseudomonas sp. WS 5010]NMX84347.1 TIR domain-containing protein [Pseudomonas sp. WS 5010]
MKVFISWSGDRSRAVAEVMSDWIKCVLQASQPWISTRHIERGSLWFSEINEKLRDISVGIVCLTQENKSKPWILFETGALAKGLSSSRVCTFLVDLQPSDLVDPLAQFNHTLPNEDSVFELVKTLNICLGEQALEERVLEKIFNVYWPSFLTSFKSALEENMPREVATPRSDNDILAEILDSTRALGKRIGSLEKESRLPDMTRRSFPPVNQQLWEATISEQIKQLLSEGLDEDEILNRFVKMGMGTPKIVKIVRELLSKRLDGSFGREISAEDL